jgi:formylglycine-generating enzyme required for sulfatase activity
MVVAAFLATDAEDPSHQIRHPVDGRLMALVDAGVFLAGTANQPLWLPAFYIDVFPVTNADFGRFVSATGHTPPQYWERGRCPDGLFDHPVVFVNWLDATGYAEWAAKSLPTSEQWEKAVNDASILMMDDDTGFRCATPAETMESLLNATRR